MRVLFFILFISLNVFGATKSLQGDSWYSNDLLKLWTPPSVSDTLVGVSATQSMANKTCFTCTVSSTTIRNSMTFGSDSVLAGTISGTPTSFGGKWNGTNGWSLGNITISGTSAITGPITMSGAGVLSGGYVSNTVLNGVAFGNEMTGTVSGNVTVAGLWTSNANRIRLKGNSTSNLIFDNGTVSGSQLTNGLNNVGNTIIGGTISGTTLSNATFVSHSISATTTTVSMTGFIEVNPTISGTINVRNDVVMVSGTAIDFAATGGPTGASAAATSERHFDSEYGTWTPIIIFSTSQPTSVTYTTQAGYYHKLNQMVCITGNLTINAITAGSGAGNVQISGTPYAVASNTGSGGGSVTYFANWVTTAPSMFRASVNTHAIDMLTSGGSGANFVARTNVGAATAVEVFGCYRTTE